MLGEDFLKAEQVVGDFVKILQIKQWNKTEHVTCCEVISEGIGNEGKAENRKKIAISYLCKNVFIYPAFIQIILMITLWLKC